MGCCIAGQHPLMFLAAPAVDMQSTFTTHQLLTYTTHLLRACDNKLRCCGTVLQAATQVYQQRMYNFLTDNCHCFVAQFLNDVAYNGSKSWNTVQLVWCQLFSP